MSKLQILVFSVFIAGVYFLVTLIFHIAIARSNAASERIVSASGTITYQQGTPYVI